MCLANTHSLSRIKGFPRVLGKLVAWARFVMVAVIVNGVLPPVQWQWIQAGMMDVGKCWIRCCWLRPTGRLTFCGEPEGGLAELYGRLFAFYSLVKSLVERVVW